MIPHERSLVERMEARPFALIGINSDEDKEKYREQAEENGVTWRSSWQGSMDGPIPTLWGVEGWPTLYLIDDLGVIREYWVGSPGNEVLDARIEALVGAAEERADESGEGEDSGGSGR